MGELDHSILLTQYVSANDAEAIAPHWTGGSYALHENRREHRVVLAYSSAWDDSGAARRYFESYLKVLGKKWAQMQESSHTADVVAGSSEDGYFVLRLDGEVVSSLEGLPAPASLLEMK